MNLTCYTLIDPNFDMVSGHGKVLGLTKMEVNIFNIKRTVIVFIMDEKGFKHDFLVGLDLIEAFHLCQDDRLKPGPHLNEARIPQQGAEAFADCSAAFRQ